MAEIMFVKSIKNQHLLYLEDKTCLWLRLYNMGQPSYVKAGMGEKMEEMRGQRGLEREANPGDGWFGMLRAERKNSR